MKRFIAIVLLVSVSACALKPAPITYMDVQKELSGLESVALEEKAADINRKISARRDGLHENTSMPIVFWIIAPLATGIIWLSFTPARRQAKEELLLMDEKQEKVKEILGNRKSI